MYQPLYQAGTVVLRAYSFLAGGSASPPAGSAEARRLQCCQANSKWLKKLNRQERVVEEVKLSLKPHYAKKHVTKEEYKDILRRSVPKICHNRSGEINPLKIASLVEAYVKRYRYNKKKSSGSAPSKPKAKTSMWS